MLIYVYIYIYYYYYYYYYYAVEKENIPKVWDYILFQAYRVLMHVTLL